MTELTVVIPMFNEQDVLPELVARLRPILDDLHTPYEVVAVDDGSADATPVLLQRYRREWPELRVVRLRANAGHQAAITAGLHCARGDYVVTMDADLQDPPEVVGEMLRVARAENVDVVYGVREDRSTDTRFKRWTAAAFYTLMGTLVERSGPPQAGDFRLMSRATVDAVNALPPKRRVLRLVVPELGFPSANVSYRRAERVAGESKYPLMRMVRLTIDAITGYSLAPLRLASWLGAVGALFAAVIVLYALVSAALGLTVPGWTSMIAAVAGVGAVQLMCLGILGEYVGRLYVMMQGKPLYYVAYDSLTGYDPAEVLPGVGSGGESYGAAARYSEEQRADEGVELVREPRFEQASAAHLDASSCQDSSSPHDAPRR